jgi:hypothetical protein
VAPRQQRDDTARRERDREGKELGAVVVAVPQPVQPQDRGPRPPFVVLRDQPGTRSVVLAGHGERDVDDSDIAGDGRGCCTHGMSEPSVA